MTSAVHSSRRSHMPSLLQRFFVRQAQLAHLVFAFLFPLQMLPLNFDCSKPCFPGGMLFCCRLFVFALFVFLVFSFSFSDRLDLNERMEGALVKIFSPLVAGGTLMGRCHHRYVVALTGYGDHTDAAWRLCGVETAMFV